MKKTNLNLIPDRVNPSPDYYCTWQTQLYATSDGKPAEQRKIICEDALFGAEKPFGWSRFYESARRDLLLVMDDSWDVPPDGDSALFGSLILDREKFPAATAGNASGATALTRLTDRIRSMGWKGLGGWVCAQEAPRFSGQTSPEAYWRARLEDAARSGFAYWKVDWGKRAGDASFRRMLTDLGHEIAPDLTVEHAIIPEILPYADAYRTYDVPAVLSIPMTMRKLAELLPNQRHADGYAGLVNCEDEAYLAAAGGFTMGIMRHPFAGPLPNGRADMSFPSPPRNLKTTMQEVTRAVRWHRIAPAFGVGENALTVDSATLCDTFHFVNPQEEIEEWWLSNPLLGELRENTATITAPARISRGCPLPTVVPDARGNVPYLVAARNPNGACSVVALGRTMGRTYEIPRCKVTLQTGDARTVAAFGDYDQLILETALPDVHSVLMQDLAADTAVDVSDEIRFQNGQLLLSGALIRDIGTRSQAAGDTSEAGVVIRID